MLELTPSFFDRHGLEVSRETCERFNVYARLLLKWQKTVNLVSAATLANLAERHFLDSAQLVKYIPPEPVKLADMGAGAGFPGLVLGMMGVGEVHLIESDVRKATFLRTVAGTGAFRPQRSSSQAEDVSRETSGSAVAPRRGQGDYRSIVVHDDRVDSVAIDGLDIITARALAPLGDLLGMAHQLAAGKDVKCLFLKGEKCDAEIAKAQKRFDFNLEVHSSLSDPHGKILAITGVKPR